MRRERMIPPFLSHGRARPAFSCGIPPNVLFPPHVRTSPKPTGKSCVFPCNSASAPHEAACHGNGVFPCAWELTHGCPWLRSTAFHVPVRAGTRSAAKKRNAPRTKNFRAWERVATLNVCRRCITRIPALGEREEPVQRPPEAESTLPLASLRRPMRGNRACGDRSSPRSVELCMSSPPTMEELNVPGCDSERTP